jgi:hypothetical protein
MLIGLLIGLSVNFRLANLFLASGYFLFFLGAFLLARNRETLLQGLSFAATFAAGTVPTLVANAINAGSPFSTTYGSVDVMPPELNADVLWAYLRDLQFLLLIIAGAWTALLWRLGSPVGNWQVALVVAGNLVVNLIFFITHPVFTPYYMVPVAMLSLWTLLFATLIPRRKTIGDSLAVRQPVKA